jgi:tetratricopeptide (TPR) repeat protein
MARLPRSARLAPALPVRWLTALFVAALAIRLAVIAQLHDDVLFQVLLGDARQYDAWAMRIVSGQWIGHEVFYQTPLYPYALAVLYAVFGHHILLVRIVQAVLGASSCVLIAIAGARFFTPRAGLAAGALLAVCGPAIFFDVLVQKSSLDLLLASALLALLGTFLRKPRWGLLVAAGVTTALFLINRENARVLCPVVAIWLMAGPWTEPLMQRAKWTLLFTAVVGLTLLPVVVRNYIVGGEFILSTAQLGPNFFIGNHAGASGVYEPLVKGHSDVQFERADAERLAVAAVGYPLSAGEVSDYWLGRGLGFIRHQTGAWIRLTAKKAAMTVAAAEVPDTEAIETYAAHAFVLRAASWMHFGVLLPVAVFGVWVTRRDWRRLSVLYLAFIAMAAAVVAFYVMARYRYPLVPLVALFAGAAVASWPHVRERRSWWLPGAVLAAVVAISANSLRPPTRDATYLNVGAELTRTGRSAEALPILERGVSALPEYAPGHFNLGVALSETGNKPRALDQFATAVSLDPHDFDAQSSLALALEESGRPEDARAHFEAAAGINPESPEARYNLGQALLEAGDWTRAAEEFTQALALKPNYAKAEAGLGAAWLGAGNPVDAIAHFEKAADLAPTEIEPQMGLGQAYVAEGRILDAIASFENAVALAESSGRQDDAARIRDLIKSLK